MDMGHMWIEYCRWICREGPAQALALAPVVAPAPGNGGADPLDQRPHTVQERRGRRAVTAIGGHRRIGAREDLSAPAFAVGS
jgi:hypothetical protein